MSNRDGEFVQIFRKKDYDFSGQKKKEETAIWSDQKNRKNVH